MSSLLALQAVRARGVMVNAPYSVTAFLFFEIILISGD